MSTSRSIDVATIEVHDSNDRTISTTRNSEKFNFVCRWLRTYFSKWTGQHSEKTSSPLKLSELIVSFVGTLIGVGFLSVIHYRLLSQYVSSSFYYLKPYLKYIFSLDLAFFMASFGASAVLLYGLPTSPLSQPRHVIGGQVISAIIGCIFRLIFGTNGELFIPVALSVASTLFLMQMTNTMHAPAGATAVLAVITTTSFPWAGFQFVLMPALSGSLILVFIAIIINNLLSNRHYPCYWW